MVKVSDIKNIPIDTGVSLDDFLLGTDIDNNKKTKNYKIRSLFELFNLESSGTLTPFSTYDFSTTIDYKNQSGVMNANSTNAQEITTFNFNKSSNTGVDLTSIFEMMKLKKEYLKLNLSKSSLSPFVNIFNILNVNSVEINSEVIGYTVGVSLFEGISIGDLSDTTEYNVDFKIVPIETAIEDLPIYNSIEEATTALGQNKIFRYSNNNLDGVPSPNASITAKT